MAFDLPTVNWRMSHELAVANEGFIWPKVIMATEDYYKVSTKVVELSLANGSIDLYRKLAWDPVLPY
ncbi:MAG: hypothetical protein EOM02_10635 [Synergistales bacterium]|nr:hypothetical protein [Synergistales bacterium]